MQENHQKYDEQRAAQLSTSSSWSSLVRYEDDNLLLCDKPFDLQIDGQRPLSLTSLLILKGLDLPPPLKFCHQLDYSTSGLITIAKNRRAAAAMSRLFEKRKIKKYYLAIVAGHLAQNLTVSLPISSYPGKTNMMSIGDKSGKEATTEISILQRGYWQGRPVTKIEARPISGRRHQIRLHCKSTGHPVVGDITYNNDKEPSRMMLHAMKLDIPETEIFNAITISTADPFLGIPESDAIK